MTPLSPTAARPQDRKARPVGRRGWSLDGRKSYVYLTDVQHNAVRMRSPDGKTNVIAQDDRLRWPDSFAEGTDVTASHIQDMAQFHEKGSTHCRAYGSCSASPRIPERGKLRRPGQQSGRGANAKRQAAWASLPLITRPFVRSAETCTVSPSGDRSFQDHPRQRVLQAALDNPLQRPRAVDRVVASWASHSARSIQIEVTSGPQAASADAAAGCRRSGPCRPLQATEQDDLVQPVQELGPEVLRAPPRITWPCTIAAGRLPPAPPGCRCRDCW